ncbi:hypothetical protein QQP08_005777 [Theobroma cacao]|nr:hypothetical protein QQP08_005777 [Theobroma cacao]
MVEMLALLCTGKAVIGSKDHLRDIRRAKAKGNFFQEVSSLPENTIRKRPIWEMYMRWDELTLFHCTTSPLPNVSP